mmetsp:Transcript_30095/g.39625  ORF Transcript_30095/g.39625 Transcript_30095/m.39625 type:complete len:140 (+) Transcript_30095:82-501(+)
MEVEVQKEAVEYNLMSAHNVLNVTFMARTKDGKKIIVEQFSSCNKDRNEKVKEKELETKCEDGYKYTGAHDEGELPKQKENNSYKAILQGLLEAKQFSNSFLTDVLEKRRNYEKQELEQVDGLENPSEEKETKRLKHSK